ncbi:serine-enriched protein-like [Liolophura sinensis]|uniref:serine-enriched protein-like n=1 Tax=Liolophura sinensis TaxID=3198878 RepID=UPI003158CA36
MDNVDFDHIVYLMNVPRVVTNSNSETRTKDSPVANEQESVYETIDETRMAEVMAYRDNSALCADLLFITSSPEMCDVVFIVGKEKVPVYGVKAILATRSRVFFSIIFTDTPVEKLTSKKSTKTRLISRLRNFTKVRKTDTSKVSRQLVIRVTDFEPEPFREVITFLHSGRIHIAQDNVIGLMNVADTYGLDDLRMTCCQYARACITQKRVLPLLLSTQPYSSFKWTKIISLEIMDFVCLNAQDLLRQRAFEALSQNVVATILSKSNLRATEEAKWDAVFRWSRRQCDHLDDRNFRATLRSMSASLNFCDIPLCKLRNAIQPLGIVSDDVINRAISHQSRPRFVIGQSDESEARPRRLNKQRGSTRLPSEGPRRITIGSGIFPLQPLASSTFNSSRLNASDSGFVLSSANCSVVSRL